MGTTHVRSPRGARLARFGVAVAAACVAAPTVFASPVAATTGADAGTATGAHPVTAARSATYSGTFAQAVASLPVAAEHRTGYNRDLFHLWIDADHDGCDTREEVLIAEAVTAPTIGPGCSLTGGTWFSYYDKVTTTDPSTFDIDHLTPLAEAWDSGAWAWTAETRERYANDLDDSRPLVAVTASANRSKSDQDPAEWMPAYNGCRYSRDWVADKIRWSLSVDSVEKAFLTQQAHRCPKATIKITKAVVVKDPNSNPGTPPPPGGGTGGGTGTGLMIARIDYDPAGTDDAANLNNEIVAIANPTTAPVSLSGWTIHDAANHTYAFPAQPLAPGATLQVHSGAGTNTTTEVYANWGYVFNNSSSETATLVAPDHTVADTCTYIGNSTGTISC